MSRVVYRGFSGFIVPEQEFTRAMFCPEAEIERALCKQQEADARAEIEYLHRFLFLERSGEFNEMRITLSFSADMLGNMAGHMDMVKEYIWHRIEGHISGLFRSSR